LTDLNITINPASGVIRRLFVLEGKSQPYIQATSQDWHRQAKTQ